MKYTKSKPVIHPRIAWTFVVVCLFIHSAFAQHRGDNLAFQGTDFVNRNGVKALAMGGAFTAISAELDATFWNPAGLIGIPRFQVAANATSYEFSWRERQDYRPNRQVVTLSFVLDGLYQPNPAFNGWLDNEAFFDDSTYIVNEPELGLDSYSEAAADWKKTIEGSGLHNLVAAMPFTLSGKPLVISGAYSRQVLATDFDRNQTHLVPHLGYNGYGDLPGRVTGATDSVRVVWSEFERQRSGPLQDISAAVAFGLNDRINLGVGFSRTFGETEEYSALNRIGNFDLVQGIQIFRFSYDTLDVLTTGKSDFSATRFNFGAIWKLDKFSLGANIVPGHTLTRKWTATATTAAADPDKRASETQSGEDKMKVPMSYTLGLSLSPVSQFRLAFDLEHRPYSKAEFSFAQEDATHRDWADQTSFCLGVEFKPIDRLSLLAGYRNIPQVFVPDGAARSDRGPEAEFYTLGFGVEVAVVRFDLAYEIGKLKYSDVYYSNTNWAVQEPNNLLFGVTFTY